MARADKWMEPIGNPLSPLTNKPIYGDPGTLMTGASIVSGFLGSDSADNAAQDSAKSTAASNAILQRQQNTNTSNYGPYTDLGNAAANKLSYYLGLTPTSSGGSGYGSITDPTQVQDKGAMGGRDFLYNAAKQRGQLAAYYKLLNEGALDASNPSSKNDKLLSLASTQQQLQSQFANQGPAKPLDISDGKYGSLLNNFSQNDLNNDVVYNNGLQFGLDQGTSALNRLASANGGIDSGATLKALTRYANDYGTTKASGAYDRFNTNKLNTYNMLSGQTGQGLNATSSLANVNSGLLTGQSNNTMQNGANQGQYGIMGAQSINNAVQGGIGNYLYNQRTNSPMNSSIVGNSSGNYGYSSTMAPWYLG